jgi:hypothetical protein
MDGMNEPKRLASELMELCQKYNEDGMGALRIFEVFATFTTMLARSLDETGAGSAATKALVRDSVGPNGWMG